MRPSGEPLLSRLLLACVLAAGGVAVAHAQPVPSTVVVQQGQTVRALAEAYLGDADLWPEILRASGLSSPADVRVGVTVRIPVAKVARTDGALDDATAAVQEATALGARLFAPDEIDHALKLHDEALAIRKEGRWEEAYQRAVDARRAAQQALEKSRAARDISAEAVLTDRKGKVEGRRAADLVWDERQRRDILVEKERLRTLSSSLGEITFRNDSRFRMDPNTNVVIQSMRVDRLTNAQETSVSLEKGDIYALLAGGGARKQFDLKVAGAQADVNSNNFWASRSGQVARFANYDEGAVTVAAGGGAVTLGRNQGTLVQGQLQPSAPRKLLPQPGPVDPDDDAVLYGDHHTLSWSAVPGAVGYWVEVADDHLFRDRMRSVWNVQGEQFDVDGLDDGTYYWHVAAIDEAGFPGAQSRARRLTVKHDRQAPYLVWLPTDSLTRDERLVVAGETEHGAHLVLDGNPVTVDTGGTFRISVALRPGVNDLVLEATDDAGRATRLRRTVRRVREGPVGITYDPALPRSGDGAFLTTGPVFTLSGRTEPRSVVAVRLDGADAAARARAGANGRFRVNVPVGAAQTAFVLDVTAPSGLMGSDHFAVVRDDEAPQVTLDAPVPDATSDAEVHISGHVEGGRRLTVGGVDVALLDGRFAATVPLAQGENIIGLVAEDAAGNHARRAWKVTRDDEAPRYLRHTLSQRRVTGGETVVIEVFASDTSGLRPEAPFTLRVGQRTLAGYLVLTDGATRYRAVVPVPPDASGAVRLVGVTLQDHHHHEQHFSF